ncbi:MAG: TatD family hydrolase [Alphaproteobacteria bacterium]|jgi:TatD DNase family protein|nr:TatD family hydrolase [Alphaproteobacteria bacterium]MBT5389805.1 TatD family hydrolase [Alphaproteobacteria bacterium]MBT5540131.1 TatD family hydrolase [Alphaproteobacteria bacterium]MBT5654021.1 TatD family hydrolase [Alphaproteobacteria bacterium]
MKKPWLVDSHCHLNFPEFKDQIPQVIQRAHEVGVGQLLSISTDLEEFPAILKIAERDPTVYCTVGVHPHEAKRYPDIKPGDLLELAVSPKVVGFGETGLDYYYEHSDREAQKKSFRAHVQASQENGLPLIIHSRDAEDDILALLKEESVGPREDRAPGVIHCFSGSQRFADETLAMGFYISLSGILTFKNAVELRETAARVPMNRLLVETDSPFLAPVPYRGKSNEPAYVVEVAKKLAEIKKISEEEVGQITTENFHRLFRKTSLHPL